MSINTLNNIGDGEKIYRPKRKWLEPFLLLAPSGVWLVLLLVLPTLIIFELSLVPGIRPGDVVNPGGISDYGQFLDIHNWQSIGKKLVENYSRILDPIYLRVIRRSLELAIGTTAICLVIAFPVAYWIAQIAPKRWRNLLLLAFVLPLWTSSLLRTYAWITILRPTGLLNTIFKNLGLPTLNILNHIPAVFIGMVYGALPYMVLILYASLEKLDKQLLEAASDLGANPVQVFFKATIPQVSIGVAASSFLVFITTLGDFVNPELLGGASSMTLARLVYNQFLGATQNWGFGSALSVTLIMLVSLAIAILIKFGEATPKR